ncbi:MAG: CoA pyrophosphatase [Bacteroidota bacterium]
MSHNLRHRYRQETENARIACVLVLLYPKDDAWHIVLIERQSSNNPNDRHKGQIGFPGGGLEESDESLLHGALREAWEEVGVPVDMVNVIGALSELYIPVSNFMVYPFLGYALERPDFIPQPSEVRQILEVPLDVLRDPASVQQADIAISKQIRLRDVPTFQVAGVTVWGATAMMLNELLEMIDGRR